MAIRTPSGFCPIITNYTGSGPGGVARTPIEGGPSRYVLAWDKGDMQFAITMRLSGREYAVWSHFYLNLIDKGATTFVMPIDSGLGMVDHDVNIMPDTYSISRNGIHTDVSFTVETEPTVYQYTQEQSQEIVDIWNLEQEVPNLDNILDRLAIFTNVDLPEHSPVLYDISSKQLFNRMSVEPTQERKEIIDSYIKSIKTSGIWDKLDYLYVPAALDAQDAVMDWKGGNDIVLVNSPTFIVDRGITFNGVNQYGTTVRPLSTLSKYALNSAHLGIYINGGEDGLSDTKYSMGAFRASASIIATRSAAGYMRGRINTATSNVDFASTPVPTTYGHSVLNRSGSTLTTAYKNGVSVGTSNAASSALTGEPAIIGAIALNSSFANYTNCRVAVVHAGSSLTPSEQSILYQATQTYLTAVGAQI